MREAVGGDEAPELLPELHRQCRIDRCKRLVAKQKMRTSHKRARNADALTLPARELIGPCIRPAEKT